MYSGRAVEDRGGRAAGVDHNIVRAAVDLTTRRHHHVRVLA